MLIERNQTQKKHHTGWFHLHKILKNANESIVAEDKAVVT